MEDIKRYLPMEPVLNCVNKHFIAMPKNDTKHNMKILKSLLEMLINEMKDTDDLFNILYREIYHGGSYFEGLRIGQPKEYDLDLVLAIPKFGKPVLTNGNIPGFVNLQVTEFKHMLKQPEFEKPLSNFGSLLDENHYLRTEKVLRWTRSVLDKALQKFTEEGKCFLHYKNRKFEVTKTSSGPAITLKLKEVGLKRKSSNMFSMDIDLVPAFVLGQNQWPKGDFRRWPDRDDLRTSNEDSKADKEFFIVPKAPRMSDRREESRERHWRLSFQKQERILMKQKQNLKPTIKLLKKMRDTLEHNAVASYYIKTAVLWIMEDRIQEERFWKQPLGYVFMTTLKKYHEFITNRTIPYYWNKEYNLLDNVHEDTLINFSNRLLNVINDIENNLDSPSLPNKIIQHLLNRTEKRKFDEKYKPEMS